jgi:small multidrug resistance family-3 protein
MTPLIYLSAAFCEIFGCFAFWSVLRLQRSPLWLIPGLIALIAFAALLTRADAAFAGRAYAAYGGVYIAASLLWLVVVEGAQPDAGDMAGAALCLAGAAAILFAPR